jgi:hypothetical protein
VSGLDHGTTLDSTLRGEYSRSVNGRGMTTPLAGSDTVSGLNRSPKEATIMATATYRQMTGPNGLIANRKPFTGNSIRAEWTWSCPSAGRLDPEEHDRLRSDWGYACARELPLYVVYSYATPIAWAIGDDAAYCTPQRFSVTTSKGQGYIRAWINANADAAPDTVSGSGYAAYRAERERLGV